MANKVDIEIVEGRGLKACDVSGSSDPYVIMRVGALMKVTKIIKKSLSPVWSENYRIDVADPQKTTIQFEILDKDKFGSDDKMGHFSINLGQIAPNETVDKWYTVVNGKGQVRVKITVWLGGAGGAGQSWGPPAAVPIPGISGAGSIPVTPIQPLGADPSMQAPMPIQPIQPIQPGMQQQPQPGMAPPQERPVMAPQPVQQPVQQPQQPQQQPMYGYGGQQQPMTGYQPPPSMGQPQPQPVLPNPADMPSAMSQPMAVAPAGVPGGAMPSAMQAPMNVVGGPSAPAAAASGGLQKKETADFSDHSYKTTDIKWRHDAMAVTYANYYNNNIERIEGLERFPNMVKLSIRNNNLEKLHGINAARKLKWVDLSSNNLVTCKGLEQCNELEWIDLHTNDIEDTKAVMALAALPNLRELNIGDNEFSDKQYKKIMKHFKKTAPHVRLIVEDDQQDSDSDSSSSSSDEE